MGTTHFSGLNVKAGIYAAADGPKSTAGFSISGISTSDTLLSVFGFKSGSSGTLTEVNIASSAVSISAAHTVTLSGTTAYSGYALIVLYLDADA